MKKVIYSIFILLSLVGVSAKAQVFWTETFGNGCTQGNLANGAIATASNGAWAVTNLAVPVANGPAANEWFISATEQGALIGNCGGNGCGGLDDRTLHLGPNTGATIDIGASYLPGAASQTNKRAESPIINCAAVTSPIQVSFKFLQQGIPASDFAELWYFDGITWQMLTVIAPNNPTCAGLGQWEFFAFGLPLTAIGNPNVRVGFRWQNVDLAGAVPGIVVDDVQLTTMTINTQSVIPCPQQTVAASVGNNAVGVTGYTWTSVPNTVTFTPNNASPTNVQYPAAGSYTLILFGSTLPGGFPTATAVTVVNVNPVLTLTVAPLSQTVCPGANATITATGANTYSWSVNAGPPIGTGSTAVVTSAVAGTSVYVVQGELGMCLSNSVLATVVYSNVPITLTVTPPSLSVCPGSAFTATASGANTFTWSIPGNPTLTPTGAVLSHTASTTLGSSIYTVTGTQGGCNGTGTLNVTSQNVGLTLTLTPSAATICPGNTITLNASGANSYTWTPPATLSSSTGVTVDAFPMTTQVYNVLGEAGGCTGNAQITVSVIPGPALNINNTANAVCTGYTSTITATGAMSYTWTGTTFTGSINQPSVSVGSGTYVVVATSTAFACPSMSTIVINTLSPLNVVVGQSSFSTCIESNSPKFSKPVLLTATGGSSYNWAPCTGGYLSICIGNTTIARPVTTTQYTVTAFTSVCSGSAVITVTVIPQTTIAVVPPQPITCEGSCFNFTVVNTATMLPLPYTYSWTVPNEVAGSVDNELAAKVVACPSVSATYSVEMRDANLCVTEQRLVTTTIIPNPMTAVSIPTINGIPTHTLCYVGNIVDITTNTLTLTAANINPTLQAGVVPTYTWYAISTPTNPIENDGSIITPTSNAVVIITPPTKLPSVRTYTVRSGFNGIPGCFAEDTISVRVIDCRRVTRVTFTTSVPNDTICTKQCITFTNTTDAGEPQDVKWTFLGGAPLTSTLQAPTVCYNLPGNWNVFLEVDNQYGPPVKTGINGYIKVVDVPNTTIIPPGMTSSDTTIRFGMSVQLEGSGAQSYAWGPNYMISNIIGPKTTVSPHQTTQYILTGFNSAGCASNDTINVIVIEDCGQVFVPNAFSPNNLDNPENETLKVYGYCLETMTFQVFNRWGQKVFETTDQKVGWDGTFNGEALNTGVFVYRLEGKGYDGKAYSMKGNVTLIR